MLFTHLDFMQTTSENMNLIFVSHNNPKNLAKLNTRHVLQFWWFLQSKIKKECNMTFTAEDFSLDFRFFSQPILRLKGIIY
jgi:hypothetical protein